MLSSGAGPVLSRRRRDLGGAVSETNLASCSILPRIWTTFSHSPNRVLHLLAESWVDELTAGREEGLLSTLLDGQLAALISYFKTKTSLLL